MWFQTLDSLTGVAEGVFEKLILKKSNRSTKKHEKIIQHANIQKNVTLKAAFKVATDFSCNRHQFTFLSFKKQNKNILLADNVKLFSPLDQEKFNVYCFCGLHYFKLQEMF